MKSVFWVSAFLIAFTYAGYPICAYLRARSWPLPIRRGNIFPSISIILAARNEERNLPLKLANLASLVYPEELVEIVVVSDGSTDETNRILSTWEATNRHAVILPEHVGKAAALNEGMNQSHGEIVVFTDVRQRISPNALKNLVMPFADPSIGCVSGELMLAKDSARSSSDGVGLYWRLEKNIRLWEAQAGSTIGATGALYAVRKSLLSSIPMGTILDDVYIPLQIARLGYRVIFEPQAVAWDDLRPNAKQEFQRKLRTLFGNYQLLQIAPWVLGSSNPLRLQFVCHKLLRLLAPFALLGVFLSSIWVNNGIYEFAFVLQVFFYALACLSVFQAKLGIVTRLSNISLAFIVLNTAAAVAFIYFITGKKAVWTRT
jgi:poly-beta-1,6-N-acetyl-D-glucosamine synthase